MATLTVRDLDERLKTLLRVRAAEHGRSMEAEVRAILQAALSGQAPPEQLGSRIHGRFAVLKGVDLDIPNRMERPRSADLAP